MLSIRLHEDAIERFAECVALTNRAIDVVSRIVKYGAYVRGAGREVGHQAIRLKEFPAEGLLTVDSDLLASRPLAFRHFLAIVRYQCWRHELPVSIGLDSPLLEIVTNATADDQQTMNFQVDLQWGHKQSALLVNFDVQIDDALANALDERISAWAAFCSSGGLCSEEQFADADEEFDPAVEVDLPVVGVDWAEWSLAIFDVNDEATSVLIDVIADFNDERRCISGVEIG